MTLRSRRLAGVREVPRAAWLCAVVATLTTFAWATLIPPFQVADETVHVSYVQYVAESGRPPDGAGHRLPLSEDQLTAMRWLHTTPIAGHPRNRSLLTQTEQRWLEQRTRPTLPRGNGGGYNEATSQPPLYYYLEAIPYTLSPSQQLIHRLAAMRLVSVLLSAVTVLFIFLFLREAVPSRPWSWTVGTLIAAFQPTFGYLGGGVTPDTLFLCAAAALFYGLAYAFRRGLRAGTAIAIGAAVSVGILTKLTFIGMVPGVIGALALLCQRERGAQRRMALGAALCGLGVPAVAFMMYVALNGVMWDRPLLPATLHSNSGGEVFGGAEAALSTTHILSYTWQLYLPRLPFMADLFSYFPPYETWLKGFVGRFGWLDFEFPGWVYVGAVGVVSCLAVGGVAGASAALVIAGHAVARANRLRPHRRGTHAGDRSGGAQVSK